MTQKSFSQIEISNNSEREYIIKWFKDNCHEIAFLNDKNTKKFKSYAMEREKSSLELIQELDEKKILYDVKNTDKLMELWLTLLSDAIIFLKSKDQREKYHDGETFGVNSLYKILEEFKKFEKVLYGASDYYRDHITHVFRVYILGERLIKDTISFENICVYDDILVKKSKQKNEKKGKKEKKNENKISPDEKEAMWCIIALTHDLGYALEKIDSLNEKIRDMIKQYGKVNVQELSFLFPPQSRVIDDFIIKFISSNLVEDEKGFLTHVQSKYYLKFYRAYEKFDHGIISCTVLMRELVFFLESDFLTDRNKPLDLKDSKQFLIRQNILRSIAVHNCEDIYHLKGRNFPFLLTIIDEFQEWGRPRIKDIYKQNLPNTSVTINKFESSDIDLSVDYTVTFEQSKVSPEEKKDISKDISVYFITKTKKFIKILRSAMGGDLRSINFSFSVVDTITNTTYKFELPQPSTGDQLIPRISIDSNQTSLNAIQNSKRYHE